MEMEMGDSEQTTGLLKLASHMKCSLCERVYEDATAINVCLHTFCHQCIHKWIEEEYQHHCPDCSIELGPSPVTKLRPDHLIRSLRSVLFPIKTPKDAPNSSSLVVTAPNLPVPTVKESSNDSSTTELSIMPRSREDMNKEDPEKKTEDMSKMNTSWWINHKKFFEIRSKIQPEWNALDILASVCSTTLEIEYPDTNQQCPNTETRDLLPTQQQNLKKLDLLPTQQHHDSEKKEEKNSLQITFKIPSSRTPVVPESTKKRKASSAGINKNPQKRHKNSGPDPPPELPEIFKSVIGEGVDAKLVIQKRLYDTDLTDNHNRLSIPLNQVKCDFLMDEEIVYLSTRKEDKKRELQSMEVNIIEPSLRVSRINFKKWDLKKLSAQNPKGNSSYVLNGSWKKIKQDNQLQVGDVIQLYAYRVEGELSFALVKLAEQERDTSKEG